MIKPHNGARKRFGEFAFKTFASLVAFLLLPFVANSTMARERPNILLIVSEDNGPELGCYGDPYVKTPVLDKLAEEGVRFDNAFVPQAGCSQSRAAFLTGLYPHQNGQIGLATWKFRMYREDTPNMIRSLKQAGYRTGMIGKLHVSPASAFPLDMHKVSHANFSRKELGKYAKHAEEFFTASEKPFFLSINYPDAHRPFSTQVNGLPEHPLTGDNVKPLAYFGLDTPGLRQQTADYYNCLSRLDSLVGDLLESLRRSRKSDNTLIVYLGDHGADLLRGKRTSYEGGIRVPLIVKHPGKFKPQQVRSELVSTIDLMPTLLAVSGTDPIANLPGRSLLPLLRDEPTDWREYLFTEFHLHSAHNFFPQRTVRNARYKLIQNLLPEQRNPGYDFTLKKFFPGLPKTIDEAPAHIRKAYHRMETPPEYELYDLQTDPYEFRNLVSDGEYAAPLSKLKKQLADWRTKTYDPLLNSGNLQKLKAEIEACFEKGKADKSRLELTYPDYFASTSASPLKNEAKLNSPDVLFITVDDMNDWISLLDPKSPIKTPNLERLAQRGMLFTRAYCASPACNPSRTATLTGLRPSTSGVYGNKSDWRGAVPNRKTIMQRFMAAGYDVRGAGKIFHHHLDGAFHDEASFDHFQHMLPQIYPPKKLNSAAKYGSRNTDWGEWPIRAEDSIDFHTASFCAKVLSDVKSDAKPLFLACGIYKPHSPFFAPTSFHESYQNIELPLRKSDDWSDLPDGAAALMKNTKWFWRGMESTEKNREGAYQEFIRSYAACATFADAQIGRVIDALDRSSRRDNTIVVLWSDHGFHLGEKDHIEKFALWEKSNHIPFIVVAPGVTKQGSRCDRPVDMTVLYPTLLALCGLRADETCDGVSITPLLRDPEAKWDQPAVMTYLRGNHAIRSDHWRYIRYADGSEELYDHEADPNEWSNLAVKEQFADVITSHRRWLPQTEAKRVPDLKKNKSNIESSR